MEHEAAQLSIINWELFLGLFLPAFGFLQVWLVKTAREDQDLYWLVRKQIRVMGYRSIYAILIAGAFVKFVLDTSKNSMILIDNLGAVFILAILVTISSLPFYDKITELPPKKGGSDPVSRSQENNDGEDKSKDQQH